MLYLKINKLKKILIEDEGIKHLSSMQLTQLTILNLNFNSIGDEGIKYLSSLQIFN